VGGCQTGNPVTECDRLARTPILTRPECHLDVGVPDALVLQVAALVGRNVRRKALDHIAIHGPRDRPKTQISRYGCYSRYRTCQLRLLDGEISPIKKDH